MVQKTASLHEKAVQKVARDGTKKVRRKANKNKPRSSRVVSVRGKLEDELDPRVFEALPSNVPALHVQVISKNEAIIWNHSAPWPGKEGV